MEKKRPSSVKKSQRIPTKQKSQGKANTLKPQPKPAVSAGKKQRSARKAASKQVRSSSAATRQKQGLTKRKKSAASKRRIPGESKGSTKKNNWKRQGLDVGIALLVTVFLCYVLSFFTVSVVKVSGYGMSPALSDGDTVLFNRRQTIRRFDLVVYRPSKTAEPQIARVIGLPGEHIRYEQDTLWVNNEEKAEAYLRFAKSEQGSSEALLTEDFTVGSLTGTGLTAIPEEQYILLGDNRSFATDSRYYGLIEKEQILGVVTLRVFPLYKLQSF